MVCLRWEERWCMKRYVQCACRINAFNMHTHTSHTHTHTHTHMQMSRSDIQMQTYFSILYVVHVHLHAPIHLYSCRQDPSHLDFQVPWFIFFPPPLSLPPHPHGHLHYRQSTTFKNFWEDGWNGPRPFTATLKYRTCPEYCVVLGKRPEYSRLR